MVGHRVFSGGRSHCRLVAAVIVAASAQAASAAPAAKVERGHWSLRPLTRPPVPAAKREGWVRTPIDAFILAKLEAAGIEPSPEAPAGDLIRRVSLDLTGLPPSPEEVDAFAASDAPEAFEALAERLLASPHHGERWARYWLDLARFAESEGFKSDETRPNAWRYRDYVVRSLNEDKPFDRFVLEQIAGDELWPGDTNARLATAFHRNYPDESNARDLHQRRQEILNDITDTFGLAFLGLTVGCARCHDHKHDPITQADYYALQAFFANVRSDDAIPLAPTEASAVHAEKLARWEEKTGHLTKEMREIEEAKRKSIADENFAKFPAEIQAALNRPDSERTPLEKQMCWKARPYLYPDRDTIVQALAGDAKKRWQALDGKLQSFADLRPEDLPFGSAISDLGREAPLTRVLSGGAHDAPGPPIEPAFLSALGQPPPRIEPPSGLASSGRRTALARWVADPANPLTARVIVNRIWHHHFGRGIAGTPSDVGTLGESPTHPELLDWLAAELVETGWSLKHIHRLIVRSSVYRQSSPSRPEAAARDAGNTLLWRMERSRLDAEAIRDAALAAAGILDRRVGGPSVFPELPEGVGSYGKWTVSKDAADRNRRSIYIFVRRNLRYPLLETFDFPDTHESCGRRHMTTTPTQALMLLNGSLPLAWARSFAARVVKEAGASREERIGLAYRIAYSRGPAPEELRAALEFLERQREIVDEDLAESGVATGPNVKEDRAEEAALADLCHAILVSNEFLSRN